MDTMALAVCSHKIVARIVNIYPVYRYSHKIAKV